jgi:hypothetical protein
MADATDLKSVLAKSEVWVRIPSSAPRKRRFSYEESGKSAILSLANGRARKRTKGPLIRQVFVKELRSQSTVMAFINRQ